MGEFFVFLSDADARVLRAAAALLDAVGDLPLPLSGHQPYQDAGRGLREILARASTKFVSVSEAATPLCVTPQRVRQLLQSDDLLGERRSPRGPWKVLRQSVLARMQHSLNSTRSGNERTHN